MIRVPSYEKQWSVLLYNPFGPDILFRVMHIPCNKLIIQVCLCKYLYLHHDDLVEVERYRKYLSDKLKFTIITDCTICWIEYRIGS